MFFNQLIFVGLVAFCYADRVKRASYGPPSGMSTYGNQNFNQNQNYNQNQNFNNGGGGYNRPNNGGYGCQTCGNYNNGGGGGYNNGHNNGGCPTCGGMFNNGGCTTCGGGNSGGFNNGGGFNSGNFNNGNGNSGSSGNGEMPTWQNSPTPAAAPPPPAPEAGEDYSPTGQKAPVASPGAADGGLFGGATAAPGFDDDSTVPAGFAADAKPKTTADSVKEISRPGK